jgi:hypothetical protein
VWLRRQDKVLAPIATAIAESDETKPAVQLVERIVRKSLSARASSSKEEIWAQAGD